MVEIVQAKKLSGVILFQLTIHPFLTLAVCNFDFCSLKTVYGLVFLLMGIHIWTKTNSAVCLPSVFCPGFSQGIVYI